jgi:hypothetical protein
MVWGLIHGSWRHRIAVLTPELRILVVTLKELWQLSWVMLKRSWFDMFMSGCGEGKFGGEGGRRLGMTLCGSGLL